MRRLVFAAVWLFAASALADTGLEKGFIRIWRENGQKVRIPVTAERMSDGAYRYRLATKDIPRTAEFVDVVPEAAEVRMAAVRLSGGLEARRSRRRGWQRHD